MNEKLDRFKVDVLEARIGPIRQLSVEDAFDMALHLDGIVKDIGPFDPAFQHYASRARDWLEAALLLERMKLS